jgi:ankyrin repeat protein
MNPYENSMELYHYSVDNNLIDECGEILCPNSLIQRISDPKLDYPPFLKWIINEYELDIFSQKKYLLLWKIAMDNRLSLLQFMINEYSFPKNILMGAVCICYMNLSVECAEYLLDMGIEINQWRDIVDLFLTDTNYEKKESIFRLIIYFPQLYHCALINLCLKKNWDDLFQYLWENCDPCKVLDEAIDGNYPRVVKYLYRKGYYNNDLIYYACKFKYNGIIKELASLGVDNNLLKRSTVINIAYLSNDSLKALIQNGLDPTVYNNILIKEIICGKPENFEMVYQYIGYQNLDLDSLLEMAVKSKKILIVKELLNDGAKGTVDMLWSAARDNKIEIVYLLLDSGVNLNEGKETVARNFVCEIIYYGHLKLVNKILQDYVFECNAYSNFLYACSFGSKDYDINEAYIKLMDDLKNIHGADSPYDNSKNLIFPALTNNTKIFQWYVNNGADIHQHNDSVLVWSSYKGNSEIVKLLLEHGADINIPLKYYVRDNFVQYWKIDKKHVTIICNRLNYVPLAAAVLNKKWDTCQLLIDWGSDVTYVKDLFGDESNDYYKLLNYQSDKKLI